MFSEFATSGMTGTAFAAHVGVKYQPFAGWVRQSRMAGNAPSGGWL